MVSLAFSLFRKEVVGKRGGKRRGNGRKQK
jgi:hypothetical protein